MTITVSCNPGLPFGRNIGPLPRLFQVYNTMFPLVEPPLHVDLHNIKTRVSNRFTYITSNQTMEPRSSNHEAATSVPTAALSAHQTQAVSVPVTTITVATTPVVSAMRPQFACQVPSITKLRHELGYGNAKLHRCEAFYDNMRVFRKRYITKSQVKSTDLQNWKWSNQQKFLNEMTREFLEVRKHGYEFWPDNSSNANYNELRYTNDEDRRR